MISTLGAVPESISIAGRSVPVIFRFPEARRTRIDSTPSRVEIAMADFLPFFFQYSCSFWPGLDMVIECSEGFFGSEFATLEIGEDRAAPRATIVGSARGRTWRNSRGR